MFKKKVLFYFCVALPILNCAGSIEEKVQIDIYMPVFSDLGNLLQGECLKKTELFSAHSEILTFLKDKIELRSNNIIDKKVGGRSFFYLYEGTKCDIKLYFAHYFDKDEDEVELIKENSYLFGQCLNIFVFGGNVKKDAVQQDMVEMGNIVSEEVILRQIMFPEVCDQFLILYPFFGKKEDLKEVKNVGELKDVLFSFIFLGKDPFSEDFEGFYSKESRKNLTFQLEGGDKVPIGLNILDFIFGKILKIIENEGVVAFLNKQYNIQNEENLGEIKADVEKCFKILQECQKSLTQDPGCCDRCCNCEKN